MTDYHDFTPRPNPLRRCPRCRILAPSRGDGCCVCVTAAIPVAKPAPAPILSVVRANLSPFDPTGVVADFGFPHPDPWVEREARRRAGTGWSGKWRAALDRHRNEVAAERAKAMDREWKRDGIRPAWSHAYTPSRPAESVAEAAVGPWRKR